MRFNLIDRAALVYVCWRTWRGSQRKLTGELPRLVSALLALFLGGGFFHIAERVMVSATTAAGITGPLGFVIVLIATFVMVRRFRRTIRGWAERNVPEEERQRRWGMVAGGTRALAIGALIILLASIIIPVGEFRKPFTRGSLFGRVVIAIVRPAYRLTHQPGR